MPTDAKQCADISARVSLKEGTVTVPTPTRTPFGRTEGDRLDAEIDATIFDAPATISETGAAISQTGATISQTAATISLTGATVCQTGATIS